MSRRDPDEPLEVVYGMHPVLELLQNRTRQVERIFVAKERRAGVGQILRLAREAGVPSSHLSREVLARKVGVRAVHQGIAAQVAPIGYADLDALCGSVSESDGLLVLLDGVVDPRNLGAILRTCAGAGVDGVILGGDNTVGLTPAVAKVAAGTIDRVPVARDARPARRLEALRGRGFCVVGLDQRATETWDEVDLTRGIVFVAGGEHRGLRPAVRKACDRLVGIPLADGVESLNVAVALGVLLFEASRQRRASRRGLETQRDRC